MNINAQVEEILGGYEMKTHNEWILVLLITAPETQLAASINSRCRDMLAILKCGDLTPEELRDFLVNDIYKTCCETSSFVKAMVYPEFIERDDHMRLEK